MADLKGTEPDNRCADIHTANTAATPLVLSDLISYQNGKKGCALIADKVGKP
jgi:hypothetical protein